MTATKPELIRTSAEKDMTTQEEFGHPRGTLAIVGVFGGLLLLGWLAMYVFVFLQRGALH